MCKLSDKYTAILWYNPEGAACGLAGVTVLRGGWRVKGVRVACSGL